MRLIQIIPIIAIIFFASGVGAVPAEEWNRTYPDLGWGISDIAPTVEGGYVLSAYDSIVKIDASGNRQWIRKLSNPETASREYSSILHVDPTADGGYIFGGSRSFIGDFGSKSISAIIRTDAEGIEQWNRTFSENIDKFREIGGGINSIQQTNDGGYILAESTIYVDTNNARIIKLDSVGNTEWTRTFDNSLRPSIRQTLDGGYILSISYGNFREQIRKTILRKLDTKGNDIWNMTYPKMDNVQVELTTDGMYMISGERISPLTKIDAFLIKIDANGNEQWSKTYGGTGDDGFGVIKKTLDGGYILAGYTGADHNTDVLPYFLGDAWLVRVDAEGNKLWDIVFGEFEMKSINSVRETDDGGYIFAGKSGTDSWVVKLTNDSAIVDIPPAQLNENDLSLIWTKLYDAGDEIYAIQQTKNGDIVLAGAKFNNYDAVLIKTYSSGKELWNNTFNGGSDERFYANEFRAVDETTDGGYILGGNAVYDIYARYDAWLVKTDSLGKEQWNKTIGSNDAEEDISAVLVVDDGYFLSVNVNWRIDIKPQETWLMRTDSKGNQLWIKKYVKGAIRAIKRAKDGGVIIVASEDGSWGFKGDDNPPTGWILRIDESGNEKWKKSFGEYPGKTVTPNSVLPTKDGGYIVVEDYSDSLNRIQNAWIIKFDQYGNENWRKIIKGMSGGLDQSFHSVVETPDGDYIIGGRINMYRTTGMDAILIKVDSSGNELWNTTAGGDGNQFVNSMQQTSDGGLIFAGSIGNPNSEGNLGAFLMKMGKKEEKNTKSDDGGRSIENLKHRGINDTVTNHANESKPLEENSSHNLAPSFELYFAVLSIVLLSIFQGKVKSRFLR